MGDHRVHIKVDFSAHGKDYHWEGSPNWSAEPGEVDERIVDFFRRSYEDSLSVYYKEVADYERQQHEIEERKQLAYLQEKYHV